MEHIFACNSVLLQMICELLNEEKLRMAAADCLFVFTERRRVNLILFRCSAIDLEWSIAVTVVHFQKVFLEQSKCVIRLLFFKLSSITILFF